MCRAAKKKPQINLQPSRLEQRNLTPPQAKRFVVDNQRIIVKKKKNRSHCKYNLVNGHGNLGEKGACLSKEKGGVFVGNGEMGHHLMWKLDMGFAVLVLYFFCLCQELGVMGLVSRKRIGQEKWGTESYGSGKVKKKNIYIDIKSIKQILKYKLRVM